MVGSQRNAVNVRETVIADTCSLKGLPAIEAANLGSVNCGSRMAAPIVAVPMRTMTTRAT